MIVVFMALEIGKLFESDRPAALEIDKLFESDRPVTFQILLDKSALIHGLVRSFPAMPLLPLMAKSFG